MKFNKFFFNDFTGFDIKTLLEILLFDFLLLIILIYQSYDYTFFMRNFKLSLKNKKIKTSIKSGKTKENISLWYFYFLRKNKNTV